MFDQRIFDAILYEVGFEFFILLFGLSSFLLFYDVGRQVLDFICKLPYFYKLE